MTATQTPVQASPRAERFSRQDRIHLASSLRADSIKERYRRTTEGVHPVVLDSRPFPYQGLWLEGDAGRLRLELGFGERRRDLMAAIERALSQGYRLEGTYSYYRELGPFINLSAVRDPAGA